MLQDIREHAKGKAAKIIVAGIAVVLCSFGLESIFSHFTGIGANKDKSLIYINGEAVSRASIDKQIAEMDRAGQLPEGSEPEMRQLLQQQLVIMTALRQYLSNSHVRVFEQEVLQIIGDQNGAKDLDEARAMLQQLAAQQNVAPDVLLNEFINRLQWQLFQQAVDASVWNTPSERQQLLALQQENRTFRYKVLTSRELTQPIEVSQQDMQQYYDEHKADFIRPEQVRFNYVLLDRDSISSDLPIDESALRQAYASKLADARPRVSDIIINISSTRNEDAARARMSEAQQRLNQGESFASVAHRYSDDSVTAARGGDLGFLDEEVFGKVFADQVKALKVGQLSKPFIMDGALHLVQVTGQDIDSFDNMKKALADEIRLQKSDAPYEKAVRKLGDLVDESDDFSAVAKTLGVPLQTSDWLAQADRQAFNNPKVMAEAFDPSVKDKGYNSQVIRLDDHRTMVLHVIDSRPAQQLSFDEAREQVHALVEHNRIAQAIDARGHQWVQQLQQGKANTDSWTQVRDAGRSSVDSDPAIIAAAFSTPRPKGEQPQYMFHALGNGDRGVVIMLQKAAVNTNGSLQERLDNELKQARARDIVSSLVEQLQKQAKVTE